MSEKKRNINLDLIRCLALILVPCIHGVDNTGIYTIRLETGGDMIMSVVSVLITICIPLYMMLTGFLCSNKTLSRRYYLGYVRIYLVYLLCCIPSLLLECLYERSISGVKEIVSAVINFNCNGYAWYIMMYTGLFLMIPFLNLMYHGCKNKRQKQLLIFSFFALSMLDSFTNMFAHLYSTWWVRIYPICYYFTGAYLREYMPELKPRKAFGLAFSFLVAYTALYCLHHNWSGDALVEIYHNTWSIYILSVLTFIGLHNLRLEGLPEWTRSAVIRISDLTLATYLLTWVPDGLIYPVLVRIAPAVRDRYIWLLVTVPLSLLTAFLMALLVDAVYKPLYRLIMSKLNKLLT